MRRWWLIAVCAFALLAPGLVAVAQEPGEGVKVGRPSFVRRLVPAAQIEKAAAQQYLALKAQANAKRALLPSSHPQAQRLQRIADDLLPHVEKWHPDARKWKWEVALIASRNINAFCMPGGKIAFFVGILEQLKLTDDEVAMIMGHEMAHALREHARERAAKTTITQVGSRLIGLLIFGQGGDAIGAAGGSLLTLKFSRDDEKEADLIGMEIAARAGYDPAAGVTLWRKMEAAAKSAPPQWMSTHPASATRVKLIQDSLKDVAKLYERGRAARLARQGSPAAPPPSLPPSPPAVREPAPARPSAFPVQRPPSGPRDSNDPGDRISR
jgi:predicted Zn-dependent protease